MSEEEKNRTVDAIKENAKPAQTEEKAEAEVKKEEPVKETKPEDTKEEKKEEKKDPQAEKIEALGKENEDLKKQIEDLNNQVAKLKNAYAMAYADTENTRKRLNKEFEQQMKYHISDFAKEILPVLDNCERALAIKPEENENPAYRKGFEMIFKELRDALKKEGVEEIEALDKPYDANFMQAMMTEHVEGKESGTVTLVLQKGYKLKDRLLRAAMVKVNE
ncbi:MAG: nucleotide exchange factor GrpE [Bulleidia sp.]|nr:nucleotide exchange factor GrpE [Bulleidia sp.]